MTGVPQTMKAIVLEGHGGLDQLVWHDNWPVPAPGPGEVLIKVGGVRPQQHRHQHPFRLVFQSRVGRDHGQRL